MVDSKTAPPIRRGLLVSNVHAYTTEDLRKKEQFHRDGRVFLKSLAQALELSPGSYEIRSNRAGMAVSGEVTLHADHLYVQLYESCTRQGITILYRSCASRKDYCGGQNHWIHPQALENDPAAQARFLDACRKLMVEGMLNARRRAVA